MVDPGSKPRPDTEALLPAARVVATEMLGEREETVTGTDEVKVDPPSSEAAM